MAGPRTATGGYEAVRTVLSNAPGTTAMIATNPQLAPGMVQAARDAGRSVPADFSIVSLASPLVAEAAVPPLTAVNFPATQMGRLGVRMLIDLLETDPPETPTQHLLRGELTVRGTTAPAPGF